MSPAGVGAAGLCAALLLAGAGGAQADETVEIHITDLAFSPAMVTVQAGTTIVWVNDDSFDHTATARSGDWDVALPVGARARLPVAKAGTFAYYCRIHPNMTGTIRVTGP